MTHVFKHPKYYKELRSRNKLVESRKSVVGGQQPDQAISKSDSDGERGRAPGPGLKQQAASDKPTEPQASSGKLQASSNKLQAPSHKRQAP